MRLRTITLQHFRNIPLATLAFHGRQQFLLGANGQGKTNLLEAAGFITALRSFRANDGKLLVAHAQAEAAIACTVEHERCGDTNLTIKLRPDGRELWCDGEKVTRIADYLGRFPTVVFTSQDMMLIRGAPAVRRRWLDLTLAAMDATYLRALQTYHRALAERNSLLKRGAPADQLEAFEHGLAPAGAELMARRTAGLDEIGARLTELYARISDQAETVALTYQPNFAETSAEALRARLQTGRTRDAQFRTTLTGPHRDDFAFSVRGVEAKDFASEGQQRSLVLALRLAQAAWFQEKSGVRPVLLADDVLGELDPVRRRRFWAALDPGLQIIASGTTLPDAELGDWQVFKVSAGAFSSAAPAVSHSLHRQGDEA
ncbi:MAG: DNA replication and repair protein RecF [Opitutaceae bacterium]|nr:DNA replication and repair protein RecF [Opitutaceae bacterium]MBP9913623.1 DNA replication and repair protein RecF [Opitutaceae bacterium]